jgi:hypothetical protein
VPPTSVAFFASRQEQHDWLAQISSENEGWFVAKGPLAELTIGQLSDLTMFLAETKTGGASIFLGRSDLSTSPIWRITSKGRELDFVRSLAVQFVPSIVAGDTMLEGRCDIHRASEYALVGADDSGLRKWIGAIRRSMRSAWKVPGVQVRLESKDGVRSSVGKTTLFSPGAVDWYRHGGKLKQFPEGTFSFVFEPETT